MSRRDLIRSLKNTLDRRLSGLSKMCVRESTESTAQYTERILKEEEGAYRRICKELVY